MLIRLDMTMKDVLVSLIDGTKIGNEQMTYHY